MGEGEAVDGDVVEARHVAIADHRLGQDAAMARGERPALGADDRADAALEQRQRLARGQALSIVGEAVVQGWPRHPIRPVQCDRLTVL